MPKKNEPTATQELTARYLAAGAGFKPEEQFFALLNAASHLALNSFKSGKHKSWLELFKISERFVPQLMNSETLEPLADDKAPF